MTLPADTLPAAAAPKRRRGRTALKLASLLGLVSFALLAVGAALGWPLISGIFETVHQPRNLAPGQFTDTLEDRDYVVSLLTSRSTDGSVDLQTPVDFDLSEIVVFGPDDNVVAVRSTNQTITFENDIFTGIALFTAEAGNHMVVITGEGATDVLLTPAVSGAAVLGMVLWAIGVVIAVAAIVLAVIGLILRRSKPPAEIPPLDPSVS